jgi:hypothetical protein
MAMALISRGWEYGRNLLHPCFPRAGHSETASGDAAAPSPAVPERRRGPGLPRSQARPGGPAVRRHVRRGRVVRLAQGVTLHLLPPQAQ